MIWYVYVSKEYISVIKITSRLNPMSCFPRNVYLLSSKRRDQYKGVSNRYVPQYSDGIMSAMASQIAGFSIAYSAVCSGADTKIRDPRHWPFVRGIRRWPLNFPQKGLTTREMFPFDDIIMQRSGGCTNFAAGHFTRHYSEVNFFSCCFFVGWGWGLTFFTMAPAYFELLYISRLFYSSVILRTCVFAYEWWQLIMARD